MRRFFLTSLTLAAIGAFVLGDLSRPIAPPSEPLSFLRIGGSYRGHHVIATVTGLVSDEGADSAWFSAAPRSSFVAIDQQSGPSRPRSGPIGVSRFLAEAW